MPDSSPPSPPRWQHFLGHGLTVLALSLGGLSSFHALRAEVVELRATVHALGQIEEEHSRQADAALHDNTRRRDADLQLIRDDIKELRSDLRELRADLKQLSRKGEYKQ